MASLDSTPECGKLFTVTAPTQNSADIDPVCDPATCGVLGGPECKSVPHGVCKTLVGGEVLERNLRVTLSMRVGKTLFMS